MKRVVMGVLSFVVLSLFLNSTGAYAKSVVKVNVPFAFDVGKARQPAGCYIITSALYQHETIMIRNCMTGAAAVSLAQPEDSRDTRSAVMFQHLGGQYFLAEVWEPQAAWG